VTGWFYYLPGPFIFLVALVIFLRSKHKVVREVTGAMLLSLSLVALAFWFRQ